MQPSAYHHGTDCSPVAYSRKLYELRSSAGSAPGAFLRGGLSAGTSHVDEQGVSRSYWVLTVELKAIIDLRPCFPKGCGGKSECYGTAILTRDK
jgi:hypothetical protein